MSRATHIAIGGSLGLAAVIAIVVACLFAFDWNRARPWIGERIAEASGRSFEIRGDLSLVWRPADGETGWRAWIPWPHLQAEDIVLGNAAWSSQPVMAQMAHVRFSVNPLGLLRKELRIPSVSLDAPQVLLERRKDGGSNWTFQSKGDSGWRTWIGRIAVNKGSVRLSDEQRRLELKGDVDTIDGGDSDAYLLGWRISGSYQGEPIHGEGRSGMLDIQGSEARYPVEVSLKIGQPAAQTLVEARGFLDKPREGPMLDLQVNVTGISLAQLYPLLGIALPETRPYTTRGRLTGTPGVSWTYRDFNGRIGMTDIAGELRFLLGRDGRGADGHGGEALARPRLEGRLVSKRLQFGDLAPLVGINPAGKDKEQSSDRLLPVKPWRPERWTRIDTDIEFTAHSVARKETLPVDSLVTRIRLEQGVLTLAPLEAGIAGGRLSARLRLDGGKQPLRADLTMSARHLKLGQLFDDPLMKGSAGEINADASLRASGKSIAGLLAGADGELRAALNAGTVSRLFLDKIGLNVSSIVAAQLFGDKQVKINCALTDVEIAKGVMRPRAFVIDTDEARIRVDGSIDLGQEKVALTVYPESKGWRLLSLRSPIHVDGNFKKREVTVDRGMLALKAGAAVALGLLGPAAAALLPLVQIGPEEGSDCAELLKPVGK